MTSPQFVLRLAKNLQRKPQQNPLTQSSQDPFLNPEPELFLQSLSSTHELLLNKFNVFDHHLLIVTTEYEPQTDLLNVADFEANLKLLRQVNGLTFYNSGDESGASQPHKHLQFVPFPMAANRPAGTLDPLLGKYAGSHAANEIFHVQEFAWNHSTCFLDETRLLEGSDSAQYCLDVYRSLFDATKVDYHDAQLREEGELSYNFLMTRKWAMIVIRQHEKCGTISVNSLGFAGTLLAKTEEQLKEIKSTGPMTILQRVAAPLLP